MDKIKGFIVYSTYRIVDDKSYIYFFGRLENGESFLTINYTRPYFYVRKKDKKKLEKIKTTLKYDTEDIEMKNFLDEPVVKVILDVPRDVPALREMFEKEDIITYEADIRFVYRYMIDKGIKGSMEIKGEFKKGNFVNRIYEEPELSHSDFKPELRVMAIDIESSMDLKNLYAVSMYSNDFSKVLIVNKKKFHNAESFETEKELLERFREIIQNYDPDIITGWNLVGFDLNQLKKKFDEHKIPFVLGRTDWPCTLRISDSFFKESTAEIAGRVALDGMHLLKTSFIALSDYKLQTAAQEILKDSKLIVDEGDKGEEIERIYKEEPQKLVDYNLKDSKLVIDILEKKGLIALTVQRSLLTGMQLDRVKASIASLDNLYIREANKLGFVCNNSATRDRDERIKGGFVKDSTPGIYDFIDVFDFKSLYPSIIRTFNIDPLAYVPKEIHKRFKEKELIISPNGAHFKKEEGILPRLIQELWQQRDNAKKKKNAEESYAIKITMNSFFGVLANPMCRFYSLEMANAITHFGQFIVKKSAEIVEEKGYRVIYGDTDSIFVKTDAENLEKAEEIGKDLIKHVNEFWHKHVKEEYGMKNFLELQFEKTFIRFLMPKIRGTEKGAKKRYAGLMLVDGKEQVKFTGLEFVRRDWTDLAKKFQLELLDKIFHKQEVFEYIKKFVIDLKKGKYDNLLVYKKSIRKNLEYYTKTTPPHVKAARKLGKLTSSIISYVMTSEGPEPIQKIEHKIDYEHYIDKQIKPIADSVLSFYETNFEDTLNESKQTSLFGFG
jgi:DNA polymerase II